MLAYQEGARPTMQQVCSALTSVSSVSREFSPPIMQAEKASVCIPELSPEDVNRLMKESWPDTFNISSNDYGQQRQFSTYSIDQLQITNVHKLPISSANLKRFQQTVGSLSSQTCMWLWHGTSSALCRNASCKRRNCSLCGVVQSGFDVERARTTTTSFQMFGKAAYFSSRAINCHSYNGQNEEVFGRGCRCMILSYVAIGNTLHLEDFAWMLQYAEKQSHLKIFQYHMGRNPTQAEMKDLWPRVLQPNFDSFHATTKNNEYFDNYMIPNGAQALPVYLITYRYPPALQEAMPDRYQGEGGDWCEHHHMRHLLQGHGCDHTQLYRSHFAGADFCVNRSDK